MVRLHTPAKRHYTGLRQRLPIATYQQKNAHAQGGDSRADMELFNHLLGTTAEDTTRSGSNHVRPDPDSCDAKLPVKGPVLWVGRVVRTTPRDEIGIFFGRRAICDILCFSIL